MAFDRPIEADQVDDLGLMSSLIRPIVWLLGGSHDEEAEGEEKLKEAERNGRTEDAIMGGSSAEVHRLRTPSRVGRRPRPGSASALPPFAVSTLVP